MQIDIDRAEIDKNVQTDHHIIGDARRVLELLNEKLPKHELPRVDVTTFSACKEPVLPDEGREAAPPTRSWSPSPELTDAQAVIATDVGQHQMWSAQYYHFNRPGQLLTSGGLRHHGLRPGGRHGRQLWATRSTRWC